MGSTRSSMHHQGNKRFLFELHVCSIDHLNTLNWSNIVQTPPTLSSLLQFLILPISFHPFLRNSKKDTMQRIPRILHLPARTKHSMKFQWIRVVHVWVNASLLWQIEVHFSHITLPPCSLSLLQLLVSLHWLSKWSPAVLRTKLCTCNKLLNFVSCGSARTNRTFSHLDTG